jgi:hypothetical protein
MTGNKDRAKLVGMDLILLVVFYTIWPCGSADEACTFIYNNGGDIYERPDISKRLKELDYSRKISSTEAYQAFTPINMLKCDLFFSQPPPLGIVTVPRRKFIDVDEFGIALERCNNKYGYSLRLYRIRKPGHYTRNQKLTVLLAIEPGDPRLPNNMPGSVAMPRRWCRVMQTGGTSTLAFASFVDHICTSIETNGIPAHVIDTDSHRVFLWDNLTSHLTPLVAQTIGARNGNSVFTSIPRPPYQPKYAPIEYKICDCIALATKEIHAESTTQDLEIAILRAAREIGPFDSTFAHCGYPL